MVYATSLAKHLMQLAVTFVGGSSPKTGDIFGGIICCASASFTEKQNIVKSNESHHSVKLQISEEASEVQSCYYPGEIISRDASCRKEILLKPDMS